MNFGDGTTETINLAAGVTTFSTTHRFLDDGNYTVTATVTDPFSAQSQGTSTVLVANEDPTVSLALSTSSIVEN